MPKHDNVYGRDTHFGAASRPRQCRTLCVLVALSSLVRYPFVPGRALPPLVPAWATDEGVLGVYCSLGRFPG